MARKIEIKEMQEIELEILKNFALFCDTHYLRYFLSNGTLLGAIRHKGFIPWDDDIDIYMPRKDYMTFLELVGSSFGLHYIVISPYNSKQYIHTYAKIYDSRTILIEYPGTLRYEIGVYIDIFPVDGLPESIDASNKFFLQMRKLIAKNWLLIAQCHIFRMSPKLYIRIYGYIISILARIICKKYYFKMLDKKARKFDFDTCNYVALTAAGYGNMERIQKRCFAAYHKVQFENYFFNAPIGHHEYLTNIYDDYMKLPPVEERVKRHNNEAYWKF